MEHFLLIFTTYTKLNLEVASDGVSLHIASTHTKKMSYRKRNTQNAFTGSENSLVAGILAIR